jgi:glutamate-1-semialdehyde 2,1-aminomutase
LVERERKHIAAVICEPILINGGFMLPKPGFLEGIREACTREGIVLIFDEVITGFRVGLHGAQGLLKIKPDMTTLGKAVANGFPLSVIGGRRDIMGLIGSGVMHGGTFNGNPVVLAAAKATLDVLARDNGKVYDRIQQTGTALMQGLREAAQRTGAQVLIQGLGAAFFLWFTQRQEISTFRHTWECDAARYKRFQALLIQHGVRVVPDGRWYVSAAHTDADVAETVAAAEQALKGL